MLMLHRYLSAAFDDCGTIELRNLNAGGARSAVFNKPATLLSAAQGPGDWFITLNRPKPGVKGAFRDTDIERIVRIPFDFDPPRPAGSNSTDVELEQAEQAAIFAENLLKSFGWPSPAGGMSGNGYHLIYRVSLPNDAETRHLLSLLHNGVRNRVPESDQTVRNPSRILRLYGTTNRKGPNLPHRPQRRAEVWLPESWREVTASAFRHAAECLAPLLTPAPPPTRHKLHGRGDYSSLNVVDLFRSHRLYKGPLSGGRHAVICPWSDEHSSQGGYAETVVWERGGSGWPTFHCLHAHCEGRKLMNVIAVLEGADDFCTRRFSRA